MKLLKNIFIGFIKPLIVKGDEEVYYEGEVILPYYIAFEFRFMLDTLFYSLLYTFLLFQFYPDLIRGIYYPLSIYIMTFWGSTMVFNSLKYHWKYKWKSKHL